MGRWAGSFDSIVSLIAYSPFSVFVSVGLRT